MMEETMGCIQVEQMTELMSLALDRELGADDQRQMEHHLATCPHCQAVWDAMQQVSTLFQRSAMVGPPLGFAIRVERRLNQKAKKQRRTLGGLAVLTGSLSLAGVTVAVVAMLVLGLVAWNSIGPSPEVQQSTQAMSKVASGMGLVGKGASLILWDLLLRYGPPLLLMLGIGLTFLVGVWVWWFVKRPGGTHRNGYA
jgi:predicted anti-sigma-YlaC factor YlaD